MVTGGDNPTDFLEDTTGNEVFTAYPTFLMTEREQGTAEMQVHASD